MYEIWFGMLIGGIIGSVSMAIYCMSVVEKFRKNHPELDKGEEE